MAIDMEETEEIEKEILNRVSGKINFKEKKNKQFFKMFLKGVAFFTIAAITGGVSGAYISNKKSSPVIYPGSTNVKTDSSNDETINYGMVSKVVDKVSPAMVVVNFRSNKVEGQNQIDRAGNGIIYKPEGYIITSYHIIKDNGNITVSLPNNDTPVTARVIGFDKSTDIAVIKIDAKNLPFAKFGDPTKLNVGDFVVAMGYATPKDQFLGTTTAGIISAKKSIELKDVETGKPSSYNLFLTNANINDGNSGGALCNVSGEVIGISSLKLGKYDQNIQGLGFVIYINNVSNIIDKIMNVGILSKPQIGVKAVTAVLEDKSIQGAYIQEVIPGTGSDSSGIKPTDIIVEVASMKITKTEDITEAIKNYKVGEKVHIKIWRNNKIVEVDIDLSEKRDNNY